MKRKLIKQGKGGYTVYLPKKWVDKRALKAGAEIEITEEGGRLVLGTEASIGPMRTIEVDLTGMDRDSVLKTFTALYESGFDEMRFNYSDPSSLDYKTGKKPAIPEQLVDFVRRFPGCEIISQGDDYYLIKDISESSEKEFDTILRRTFFLLLEFDKYIKEGLGGLTGHYKQGTERYRNISRFVSYCLRLLNKRAVPEADKYNLYVIISSLEEIATYYRYLSDDLDSIKPSKMTSRAVEQVSESLQILYDFFYTPDNAKMKRFNKINREIEKEMEEAKLKHREFMMLYRFITVLDVVDYDLKCMLSLNALSKN